MNKKMCFYVALIMILGICYSGSVLFYNPYASKSYVYSYPETNLQNKLLTNNVVSEQDKQSIDTFLRPLVSINPNLNDSSDIQILTNIINIINQKQEYTLNGNTQIYSIDLIKKYALEYFNKTEFNPNTGNGTFYYNPNQNSFVIYYNYTVPSANIVDYEITKKDNTTITAKYTCNDLLGNNINYEFELTKSNNQWIIITMR